jgi:hypothetical protein
VTQRARSSEVRYETRKALGPSFDFTDESYRSLNSSCSRKHINDRDRENDQIHPAYSDDYHHRFPGSQSAPRHEPRREPRHAPRHTFDPIASSNGRDVVDMISHVDQYQQAYGNDSQARVPAYRENKNGKPIPGVEIAMTAAKSSFCPDDNSSLRPEEKGKRRNWRNLFRRRPKE